MLVIVMLRLVQVPQCPLCLPAWPGLRSGPCSPGQPRSLSEHAPADAQLLWKLALDSMHSPAPARWLIVLLCMPACPSAPAMQGHAVSGHMQTCPCRGQPSRLSERAQADAQLLSMIMLVQDILLDDLAHSSHSNGSGSNGGSNGLVPHQRNLDVKAPTHVVGVVRCPPSVEVCPMAGSPRLGPCMQRQQRPGVLSSTAMLVLLCGPRIWSQRGYCSSVQGGQPSRCDCPPSMEQKDLYWPRSCAHRAAPAQPLCQGAHARCRPPALPAISDVHRLGRQLGPLLCWQHGLLAQGFWY